eukprot:scaffold23.g4132.t1
MYTGSHGTWMGHVLPGIVFCIWGAHMLYHVCCYFLYATPRRPYAARAWYPLALRWLAFLEPAIKLLLPPVAVSIELYFDHDAYRRVYGTHCSIHASALEDRAASASRAVVTCQRLWSGKGSLYCPKGTLYAGRFALTHMNNWQHTSTSDPAFMLSGLVDIVSAFMPLPPGLSHGFLALAVAAMSFIMGTHEKHRPMDAMAHWLLWVSMVLILAALVAEMVAPRQPAVGLGKAAAFVFQGAWLIQLGRMEFEDHPQWSEEYAGGAMMAPFAFVLIGVTVAGACFAFLVALAALKAADLLRPIGVPVDTGYLPAASVEDSAGLFECDSARDSDDGGAGPAIKRDKRRHVVPFQIVQGGPHHSAHGVVDMHAV